MFQPAISSRKLFDFDDKFLTFNRKSLAPVRHAPPFRAQTAQTSQTIH